MAVTYSKDEVKQILELQTQYRDVVSRYTQPNEIQFISQENYHRILSIQEKLQQFPEIFEEESLKVNIIIEGLEGKVQNI